MNTTTSTEYNNKVLKFVCSLERYISVFDNENEDIKITHSYKECLRSLILDMYNGFFIGKLYTKSPFNPLWHDSENIKIEAMFFENLGFKFLLENKQDVYFFKSDIITDVNND